MWGFTIYLMRLADYIQGRKYGKKMKCDLCGQKFSSIAETEEHRRINHPYAHPGHEKP
jgi:hypothetical protein